METLTLNDAPRGVITRLAVTTTESLLNVRTDHWVGKHDDMIHRSIVDQSTRSVRVFSIPTVELAKKIDVFYSGSERDVVLLKKFATWQRKYIDFQATYSAYLLGALSEDEFEADSEQYAPQIRKLEPQAIVEEIQELARLLEFGLRPAELAEYFETEQSVINAALERINQSSELLEASGQNIKKLNVE